MNKEFWDTIVNLWCVVSSEERLDTVAQIAKKNAMEDQKMSIGYSINCLDDEEDEDDW